MAVIDFDIEEAPESSFEPLPPGEYESIVIESESRPIKDGNGLGYLFRFEVVSGDKKGRTFTEWFNIKHPSPSAAKMGKDNLNRLCNALGIRSGKLTNTSELHNKPVMVLLGLNRKDRTRNEVKAYKGKTV